MTSFESILFDLWLTSSLSICLIPLRILLSDAVLVLSFECDSVELSSWVDESVWSRISSTDECALSLVDSMSF